MERFWNLVRVEFTHLCHCERSEAIYFEFIPAQIASPSAEATAGQVGVPCNDKNAEALDKLTLTLRTAAAVGLDELVKILLAIVVA